MELRHLNGRNADGRPTHLPIPFTVVASRLVYEHELPRVEVRNFVHIKISQLVIPLFRPSAVDLLGPAHGLQSLAYGGYRGQNAELSIQVRPHFF